MNQQPDFAIIEKIIAGDIRHQKRREILLQWDTEESTSHWRELALGFLEQQLLKQAFEEDQTIVELPKNNHTLRLFTASAAMLLLGLLLNLQFFTQTQQNTDIAQTQPPKLIETVTSTVPSVSNKVNLPQHTTAYVTTHLTDGRNIVIPISYIPE